MCENVLFLSHLPPKYLPLVPPNSPHLIQAEMAPFAAKTPSSADRCAKSLIFVMTGR